MKPAPTKIRIDTLLFEKGLAPSCKRAQAYLMAGKVLVNGQKIEKSGTLVKVDAKITILGENLPYVSRGGLKLEKALAKFNIDVHYCIAMDIGASTGGFTDCLLQQGASRVFAIDVGTGQLAWKLRQDSRVHSLEKTHFSHLDFATIGTFVDLIVIDVSFISLEQILKHCSVFLKTDGHIVALIKPQFEAGKDQVQKRGLITDAKVHQSVIEDVSRYAASLGFAVMEVEESPILGKKSGNREFLLHLKKTKSLYS